MNDISNIDGNGLIYLDDELRKLLPDGDYTITRSLAPYCLMVYDNKGIKDLESALSLLPITDQEARRMVRFLLHCERSITIEGGVLPVPKEYLNLYEEDGTVRIYKNFESSSKLDSLSICRIEKVTA